MSGITMSTAGVAPRLVQSVRWGENYVSCALNAKFAGVVKPGIYQGFILKPAGTMTVRVDHGDACRSVAVVERDGYSITVIMLDGGEIKIPTRGTWHICIEAYYATQQPGYQRIVARQTLEGHHVVIGTVTVNENGVEITSDMLSTEERRQSEIPSRDDYDELVDRLNALRNNGDGSTLPDKWNSLKKMGDALGAVQGVLDGFFNNSPENGGTGGLSGLQAAIALLQNGLAALADRKQQAWTLAEAIPEGGTLALPVSYIPGTNALLLHWDGIPLTPGVNFEERGTVGQPSTEVTLLFPAPGGAEFHAIVLGGDVPEINPGPDYDPLTGAYRGPVSVGTSLADMKDTGMLILLESERKASGPAE